MHDPGEGFGLGAEGLYQLLQGLLMGPIQRAYQMILSRPLDADSPQRLVYLAVHGLVRRSLICGMVPDAIRRAVAASFSDGPDRLAEADRPHVQQGLDDALAGIPVAD
jgi:hypothetical protein